MIHVAMMLTSEQGSFQEEWAELAEEWHDLLAFYTSKEFLMCVLWCVIVIAIESFLFKKGLLDNRKKKAIKHDRTITANYIDDVPKEVFRGEVDAEDIRMFHYSYTHPRSGKMEQYELDFSKKGAPPLQLTLYYTEDGKVFDETNGSKISPFWLTVAIALPFVLALLLVRAFGIEIY